VSRQRETPRGQGPRRAAEPDDPPPTHQPPPPQTHWLSFDVEEYFQVEAAARCVPRSRWELLDKRLPAVTRRILDLLDESRTTATFFVLGWVARHEGKLVRRIAEAGHEIASHGADHRMIAQTTPGEFRRDLDASRKLLEDICGRAVIGYRAPTFSITNDTAWALDVLAEAGFRYDSSVFPVRHDRYGVPDAPATVHWASGPGGGRILEIPPATVRVLGANWPVGGGGYLRLLPVRCLARVLTAAQRRNRPCMIYLHPWELDPHQPTLPMGRMGTFRHRVGLRGTEGKLRRLLQCFEFTSVAASIDHLTRTTTRTYAYGRHRP